MARPWIVVVLAVLLSGCATSGGPSQGDEAARPPEPLAPDSLEAVRQSAERSDPEAQFELSRVYLLGLGAPQDLAESVRWLRMSAEQGYARAQYTLGLVYAIGIGVPADDAEAVRWYRLGRRSGPRRRAV